LSCGRRWRGGRRIAARDNEDGKEETRHGSHYVSQSAVSVVFVNVRRAAISSWRCGRDIVDGRWAEPGATPNPASARVWALRSGRRSRTWRRRARLSPGVFGDAVSAAVSECRRDARLRQGWTDDVTIR
jgi:hypothetical protein